MLKNYFNTFKNDVTYALKANYSPSDTLILNGGSTTIDYNYTTQECNIIIKFETNSGSEPTILKQNFYNAELWYKESDNGELRFTVYDDDKAVITIMIYNDETIEILLPNAYMFNI